MNACPSQLAVVLSGKCHGLMKFEQICSITSMRGLLERILLSPEHENTGLESVRIIKARQTRLWAKKRMTRINQTMGKKEDRQDKPD